MNPSKKNNLNQGFTLIENLVIITIIGILGAIAAPSWLSFINIQRLNTANNQVYLAMQEAKSNAIRDKATWQVSFREDNGIVQWSLHKAESGIFMPNNLVWNSLDQSIEVYKEKNDKSKCETTLDQPTNSCPKIGPWRVQFNYQGNTNGQLGQFTLIIKGNNKYKRCVYVSTLIGAMRTGKENSQANNSDKYCY